MGCFSCKEKGYLAANCPNVNIANELPSDNTETGNIGNDPPVATNIQTEQTPESPQTGQKKRTNRPNLTPPNPQMMKPPLCRLPHKQQLRKSRNTPERNSRKAPLISQKYQRLRKKPWGSL
ncbi:hypothetical protein JTB14_024523 [Gonioctena quinquepunctata]|nr:hypothetical protein JTB14_024523 [Gonioctena quinquepunctata]